MVVSPSVEGAHCQSQARTRCCLVFPGLLVGRRPSWMGKTESQAARVVEAVAAKALAGMEALAGSALAVGERVAHLAAPEGGQVDSVEVEVALAQAVSAAPEDLAGAVGLRAVAAALVVQQSFGFTTEGKK